MDCSMGVDLHETELSVVLKAVQVVTGGGD